TPGSRSARRWEASPPTATIVSAPAAAAVLATRTAMGWPSTASNALSRPIRRLAPPHSTAAAHPEPAPASDLDMVRACPASHDARLFGQMTPLAAPCRLETAGGFLRRPGTPSDAPDSEMRTPDSQGRP